MESKNLRSQCLFIFITSIHYYQKNMNYPLTMLVLVLNVKVEANPTRLNDAKKIKWIHEKIHLLNVTFMFEYSITSAISAFEFCF